MMLRTRICYHRNTVSFLRANRSVCASVLCVRFVGCPLCMQDPISQFFVRNPAELLHKEPEAAVLDSKNELVRMYDSV